MGFKLIGMLYIKAEAQFSASLQMIGCPFSKLSSFIVRLVTLDFKVLQLFC